jgi:GNAT superfamily N-acetyltransferase
VATTAEARLRRHLRGWLGRWPGRRPVDVVGSVRRERPAWDGQVNRLVGLTCPDWTVLSVSRGRARVVRDCAESLRARPGTPAWDALLTRLPHLLDRPDQNVYSGVFRWCDRPTDLVDAGVWEDADDPAVPPWLRPFGHQVLIARDPDSGDYLAGVGIKRHDRYGRELAVGTEPAARGRGLARRLVAQAARRVLDEGAVPTYQHAPSNVASARVADAAGFPDRGWQSLGMW